MKTTALILTIFLSLFTAPKAMSANGDGSGNVPKSVIQTCMYGTNANGDGSGNVNANGDGSGNDSTSTKANGDGSGNNPASGKNRYVDFLRCIKKY